LDSFSRLAKIPNLQPKETKFRCAEHQIEEKEVLKFLLDINPNKSPGPDGIHPKTLKETAAILAKPLTKIQKTISICVK
jgi:hypothetical protein